MYRPLGAGENILWLLDQVAPGHFAVTAQVTGELVLEQLQQALSQIQQRHPLLRVCIVPDASGKPWFVDDSAPIPLRVVQRQNEQHWLCEVEQELYCPFDWNQAPLIRVVLVQSKNISEIILITHHSISDGTSSAYLLRDILQAVATPRSGLQTLPEYPAFEDLLVNCEQPILNQYSSTQRAKSQTKSNVSAVNFPQYSQAELFVNRRPRVLAWSLSSAETNALISTCRQEQTTVHGAICAAFLFTIYSDEKKSSILKCMSPVSIRRYLPPNMAEDFGFYFTITVTSHAITDDNNFWELARSLKSQLHQQISLSSICTTISQQQALISTNPNPKLIQQVSLETYGFDILVTNLTRLNIQQEFGQLQLRAIYGPAVTPGSESDRVVGVATLGDTMFFTFTYFEPEMQPAEAVKFQQAAMQQLKKALVMPVL